MYKVNLKVLYDLGKILSTIGDVEGEEVPINRWAILKDVRDILEKFLSEIENAPMPKSREAARSLYESVRSVYVEVLKTMQGGGTVSISPSDIERLTELLATFEKELDYETHHMNVFAVPDRHGRSATTLIDRGEELLEEADRQVISAFAVNEFREAGKCIAFSLPTAAGFHLLRAFEAVLRQYYDVISGGKPRPRQKSGQGAAMGAYISEIEKYDVDPKSISVLREIKDLHRNPWIHPEDVMTMRDANSLLGIVMAAIQRMVEDMRKKGVTSPPS